MIKLFKLTSIYTFGLFLGRISSVVLFLLLARRFTPGVFGDLILFVTLIQLVTFFSDFGLNQWYQKKADGENKDALFTQVIFSRILTLFLSFIFIIPFLFLTKTFSVTVSLIFIFAIIPESFLSLVDGYYLEKAKPVVITLKLIVRNLIIFFGYFFYYQYLTLETILIFYFLGNIVAFFIVFPYKKLVFSIGFCTKKIVQTLKGSFFYATLVFTSYFYARGDHLAIKYLLNSQALGYYGAAYRFLEGLSIIPTALYQNLFPLSAKKKSLDKKTVFQISAIMTLIGLIIGLILFFSAGFLISFFVGKNYLPAVVPLKIFSFVLIMFFVNSSISSVVQSSDLIKRFLPFGIGNTIFNLFLNILFVPTFGINAAAAIMLATEITGFFINIYFVKILYAKS